jgi:hypothetical protein
LIGWWDVGETGRTDSSWKLVSELNKLIVS